MPHNNRSCSARFTKVLLTVLVFVTASCLLTRPAFAQGGGIQPSGCDNTGITVPTSGNFSSNFLQPEYQIGLNASNAANAAGDLNSTYFQAFYSAVNAASAVNPNSGLPYCPFELVVTGTFPNARYFSVTQNDMHYTAAQQLADIAMDPLTKTTVNPYVPSTPFQSGQAYLVPISLGSVPVLPAQGGTETGTCQVSPYEEDNLLDGTQRHQSMDWNTDERVAPGILGAQGVTIPNYSHVVDTPEHAELTALQSTCKFCGSNAGGRIIIRSYLGPPYACQGEGGTVGNVSCPSGYTVPTPTVIIRDAYSGCAYPTANLSGLIYSPSPPPANGTCYSNPSANGCNAIVSTVDLSTCPSGTTNCTVLNAQGQPNWLDQTQKNQHTTNANITPEACYANGDPSQGAPFANKVAWTRVQEWEGTPGPDDSYIGGAVSSADLESMRTNGTVIRFRFRLPYVPTPATPPCTNPASCSFTGSESLRYMSLTFWNQPQSCPATAADFYIADPDGTDAATACSPVSILSLADVAFAPSPGGYATLVVNVDPNVGLPSFLQQTKNISVCVPPAAGQGPAAALCGVAQGAVPPTDTYNTKSYYSVWWPDNCAGNYRNCDPYTVVDLSRFTGSFSDRAGVPLLLTIRNTLPTNFACSGAAVPFSTAEYTNVDGNGGGLMGPYAPLVDYPVASALQQTPAPLTASSLPSAGTCGTLTGLGGHANNQPIYPSFNSPSIVASQGGNGPYYGSLNWPTQYWPSSGFGSSSQELLLTCPAAVSPITTPPSNDQTEIYFAATQRTTLTINEPGNECGQSYSPNSVNPCTQIVAQSAQETYEDPAGMWQPPLPIKIEGQGFGTLPPSLSLPLAVQSSPYIEIHDDQEGGGSWDTDNSADCQMYIANWTDSSIALIANVPIDAVNGALRAVTPLIDATPVTLTPQPGPPPLNSFGCPVAAGDNLTFTIKNPQTGAPAATLAPPVTVQPLGTPPQ